MKNSLMLRRAIGCALVGALFVSVAQAEPNTPNKNPATTPVPMTIEVTQGGERALYLDSTVLGGVELSVTQPSERRYEPTPEESADAYRIQKTDIRLQVLDVTDKTVSVSLNFSDRSDTTLVSRVTRLDFTKAVKGQYSADGSFAIDRNKPFKIQYQICQDVDKTWCQGLLTINVPKP